MNHGEGRRTVVITGCHRSGTSAIAGMLAQGSGLQFGHVNRQYLADNARGNYEHPWVVETNDELIGGDWKDPRTPPEGMLPNPDEFATHYPHIEGTTWAIKDPRFVFTLDAWRHLLGQAYLIAVTRKPEKIVQSMIHRERALYGRFMSGDDAWRIQQKYARALSELSPVLTVDFENGPWEIKDALAGFCWLIDVPYDPTRAMPFYSPILVHQR